MKCQLRLMLYLLLVIVAGCSANRNRNKLVKAVDSEITFLQDGKLPGPFLKNISDNEILILGEEHYVQEHQEFIGSIIPQLYEQGYRQLLIEDSHAFSWAAEDYVLGLIDEIPWRLRAFHGLLLEKVRQFNSTLPMDERIRVNAIDITHSGFGESRQFLASRIKTDDLFKGLPVSSPEKYQPVLEEVRQRLENEKERWETLLTPRWYARILEMVEVELASNQIRKWSDPKNDDANREKWMITLIERRMAENKGRTIINCGQTHAQKQYYREWGSAANYKHLGMYLHEKYKTYHVAFWGAKGEKKNHYNDTKYKIINRFKDCPKDDIVRILAEKAGDIIAMLPLDADIFKDWATAGSFKTQPQNQFDAYILYPKITFLQSLKDAEPRLMNNH